MPPSSSNSGVNGGCAMIGSARLIFRMIANGARKKASSHAYGTAMAKRCQGSRRAMSARQHHGALRLPRNVDLVVPFQEALGRAPPVLRAHLHDPSGLEAYAVQREVAEIAEVPDDAFQAHVLEPFRLSLADEDLLRADGDAHLAADRQDLVAERREQAARLFAARHDAPVPVALDDGIEHVDRADEV